MHIILCRYAAQEKRKKGKKKKRCKKREKEKKNKGTRRLYDTEQHTIIYRLHRLLYEQAPQVSLKCAYQLCTVHSMLCNQFRRNLHKLCKHFQHLTTRPGTIEIQLVDKPKGSPVRKHRAILALPRHLEPLRPTLCPFSGFCHIVHVLVQCPQH